MTGPSVFLTIFALLASCTLASANAQQAGTEDSSGLEPVELAPVMVHETSAPSTSLTQPSYIEQSQTLQRVPGGTNLIDETRLKTGKANTITDILQQQPGVFIGSRGSGDEAKISIRGSAIDRNYHLRGIKLLQDSIPMTRADGNSDFQWIEPLTIRNVEIYRGGNALQYGATTLGGAINFLSHTGNTASPIQARVESGSNGYIKGQISSGMVLGNLDYYISGTAMHQNGFQEHSRSQAQRYTANLGYRFSPTLKTRFYGGYTRSRLELPGSLTENELRQRPSSAAPNSVAFNEQHNVIQTYLANKLVKQFDDHHQLQTNVYWTNHSLEHPLFWNPFFLNGLGVLDQDTNTYGAQIRYINSQNFLGKRNSFTLGFAPQFSHLKEQRFQNLFGRNRGSKTAHNNQLSSNIDLHLENQHYLLNNLALVAGGQLSYSSRNYYDYFERNPNGKQTRRQDYFSINPKIGLLYNANENTQFYANYNRSFEPPTMLEIAQLGGIAGNITSKQLKAQTANTLEIGTRGQAKRVSWDTTFYRSWVRNELLSLNDELGNPQGTINGNRTIHQGVEAGLSIVLMEGLLPKTIKHDYEIILSSLGPGLSPQTSPTKDHLVLRQVFDWTNLKFTNDPIYGNRRLPGIPTHFYRSEFLYEHPSGFYIQPNLEWNIGKFAADYANSLYANRYAIFGLKAGYHSKRGWSAFVEFKNLTNKRYASSVQTIADARTSFGSPRVFSPGQGFSVYGGIELRW